MNSSQFIGLDSHASLQVIEDVLLLVLQHLNSSFDSLDFHRKLAYLLLHLEIKGLLLQVINADGKHVSFGSIFRRLHLLSVMKSVFEGQIGLICSLRVLYALLLKSIFQLGVLNLLLFMLLTMMGLLISKILDAFLQPFFVMIFADLLRFLHRAQLSTQLAVIVFHSVLILLERMQTL